MVLDESEKKVVSDLRRKRGVVKASLTRIRKFVQNFRPSVDAVTLLEFRQEELPIVNRKFDEIQSQIELIDIDNADIIEQEREEFENDYYAIRSEMQELINSEKSHNTSMQNNTTNTSMSVQRARLAPLSLPKFNGNIQEWESYFDCFKAMVHNEDVYPPAQKFSYLRSSLSGAALDIIKAIPMTENNYSVAIKRLQQRYENRSMVIQSHIRAMLDFPKVESAVAKELQALHSNTVSHVAALEALGQPIHMWDAWLVTIMLRKVDHGTCHEWQIRRKDNELPKFKELDEFLASRCIAFESSETWDSGNTESKKKWNNTQPGKKIALAVREGKPDKCACCSEIHKIYTCKKFKELAQAERFNVVRTAHLCFNCLSPYHMSNSCQSKSACLYCKGKHNTLLHYETTSRSDSEFENKEGNQEASTSRQETSSQVALSAQGGNGHVFLATASILIADNRGEFRKCYAVLDSGSQMNFISRNLANRLKLQCKKAMTPVSGIGTSSTQSAASTTVKIKSRLRPFDINLACHVLPVVVEKLPSCATPRMGWMIPLEYKSQLADPEFGEAKDIDLLIGGGTFFELLGPKKVALQHDAVKLQESMFGWIDTGEFNTTCLLSVNMVSQTFEEDLCAEQVVNGSFGSMSKGNKRSLEEQEAMDHFQRIARRDENGRFVLRLPVKPEVSNIGKTLDMATSRFISVERRLQRDEGLREAYTAFMREYESAGHMQEVTDEPITKISFYLPHHPVLKTSSLTTKLRVVFDASAKSSTGVSLNDVLMCGPTVQEDLFSILARFRMHQYVITADVEKMFRQIIVDTEDQNLQCILWREKPSDSLRKYRLTTVTYGTTSASFMATQCLVSLAEGEKQRYPKAAAAIQRDFYMDDLITGTETIQECILLQTQIYSILQSAKLPLRKWCSNSHQIIACVAKDEREPLFVIRTESDDVIKALGLCWKPTQDEFTFQLNPIMKRVKVTKRMLLSDLNKTFDPLGFLTPVLITGKIFLQQLW